MDENCLNENYPSLKYPCFSIGSCKYDEFVTYGEETTGTPVKYFDDGTHEVNGSVKQWINGHACFHSEVGEVIYYVLFVFRNTTLKKANCLHGQHYLRPQC